MVADPRVKTAGRRGRAGTCLPLGGQAPGTADPGRLMVTSGLVYKHWKKIFYPPEVLAARGLDYCELLGAELPLDLAAQPALICKGCCRWGRRAGSLPREWNTRKPTCR